MCRNQIKRNARIQPSACLQIQAALTGGAPLFCWWRGAAFPTDGGAPLCWWRGAAFLLAEGRRSALACGWRGDSLGRRFPAGVGAVLGACLGVEGRRLPASGGWRGGGWRGGGFWWAERDLGLRGERVGRARFWAGRGASAWPGSKPEILGERGGGGSGERAEGEGAARFWVAALPAAREGGGGG